MGRTLISEVEHSKGFVNLYEKSYYENVDDTLPVYKWEVHYFEHGMDSVFKSIFKTQQEAVKHFNVCRDNISTDNFEHEKFVHDINELLDMFKSDSVTNLYASNAYDDLYDILKEYKLLHRKGVIE